MRKFAVGVVAMAGMCAAAPAFAQMNVRTAVIDAASCIVDNEPDSARAVLDTLPGSTAEASANRKLATILEGCSLDDPLKGDDFYGVRPALAVAMVQKMLGEGARPTRVATPSYASALSGRVAGRDYDPVALGRQQFGTCVVAAAPEAAANLLKTEPGSRLEGMAFAQLRPALAPCVVRGKPITFTKPTLRLLLAEPLYHAISG